MLIIAVFILGIVVLLKNKISFSKNSEIRRPRTYILGTIMILVAGINQFVHPSLENVTYVALGFLSLPFVPLIAAILLKQPKIQ